MLRVAGVETTFLFMTSNSFSFEKSLKPLVIEEWLDLVFFRKVAFFLVPTLHRLGLSPNQVSFISLSCGVTASILVYYHFFILGALMALAAISFDCCDGQIARLTGKASPLGRVTDGLFDLIWVACFWSSIYFSGYFQSLGFSPLWMLLLMSFSGASMIFHCWRFDGIKLKYLELAVPNFSEKDLDYDDAITMMKQKWKERHIFETVLCACIAFQVYFFVRGKKKKESLNLPDSKRIEIKEKLDPIMKKWPWLGESHHNTSLILGVMLAPLTPYALIAAFGLILIPMNILFISLEIQWQKAIKEVNKNIIQK